MDYRDYPEYTNALMRYYEEEDRRRKQEMTYNYFMERYRYQQRRRELLRYYERDCNSRGEPDLVGYKVLVWGGDCWRSPIAHFRGLGNVNRGFWLDEKLVSDEVPTPYNANGIYVAKSLDQIIDYLYLDHTKAFLVGMKPRIVEHEAGYRAHKAYIIEEVVV